jgi:glutathionylspermidine synthase
MEIQEEKSFEDLSYERRKLAYEYSDRMKELGRLRRSKALKILEYRADGAKSMIEAERKWDATEDGQMEIQLQHECKGLEQIMQALHTEIKLKIGEAYSQI